MYGVQCTVYKKEKSLNSGDFSDFCLRMSFFFRTFAAAKVFMKELPTYTPDFEEYIRQGEPDKKERATVWLRKNGYINRNHSKIKGEWQLEA